MDIVGTINQHGKITISLGTGNVATLKGDLDETGSDTAGIIHIIAPLSSKKPGRNIWTGGGYRTAFVGKDFFGDIGQERARPCRSQTRERVMLDERSTGQKKPERNGIIL